MKRVLCLGSEHPADRIGWEVADALGALLGDDYDIRRCNSPAQLFGLLDGIDALFIVDALIGCRAGEVREIAREELAHYRSLSSHGGDLGAVLETAKVLGDLPARCILVGIGVGEARPEAVTVDRALVAAIAELLAF